MKNKNPLVSIIVPLYNCEKYVDECIRSLLNQTYSNIEIIVIDDGSTDDSIKVVEKIEDSKIKIIKQQNKGANLARHAGIKKSKGSYCMFIDADDFIERETVEKLVCYIDKYNLDTVRFCGVCFPSNTIKNNYDFKNQKIIFPSKTEIYNTLLFTKYLSNLCYGIYKKDLLIENEAFKTNYSCSEDYYANLVFYTNNIKVAFVDEKFYYYRENQNSTTKSLDIDKIMNNAIESIDIYGKVFGYVDKWNYKIDDMDIILSIRILELLRSYITRIFYVNNINYNKVKNYIKQCIDHPTFDTIRTKVSFSDIRKNVLSRGLIYNIKNYYLFKCILNKKYYGFYLYSKIFYIFK